MTRIISGSAGGIRLDVPAAGTRPTSERVREALFSALDAANAVDGARVLDLYAGSGALGLEALSRGGATATLVERGAPAVSVAQKNASRVSNAAGGHATVHRAAVAKYLEGSRETFDLVLIDPPYDLAEAELAQVLELLVPRLAADALIVVERGRRSPEPAWPDGVERTRDRAYGDTVMWWAQPRAESQSR
ncbi:16S rRNA (guanine966-N2)-methyltransferase [Microbacterium endophyticum]|uniref:16S rRNA (Guanine966-N2)-methyltransferase n=1 Tax=Microbacterium endophyticum TaxID=1526412 RepID=A0A7W4YKQ5_9MICO|nr:16S rRNA (guanine(966)-N(2))-methyltransferase RsmD [Microbacterium endophyticum]MBB2974650.1 16S rRNA (guanine966-N2)-methyltransferase [Microbacterium endophyticum]NIK36947.1 16S rRNA (guanine966-N2)-methyltransferase [Microbacterium endophyticum]